jgi:hypothetical protein
LRAARIALIVAASSSPLMSRSLTWRRCGR